MLISRTSSRTREVLSTPNPHATVRGQHLLSRQDLLPLIVASPSDQRRLSIECDDTVGARIRLWDPQGTTSIELCFGPELRTPDSQAAPIETGRIVLTDGNRRIEARVFDQSEGDKPPYFAVYDVNDVREFDNDRGVVLRVDGISLKFPKQTDFDVFDYSLIDALAYSTIQVCVSGSYTANVTLLGTGQFT